MTDQEIIERAKKIAACVPFIDTRAGVVETQECIRGLIERVRVLGEAIDRIATLTDCPDLSTGDMRKGLHCGLEDRDIIDRYDAADYGFEDSSERWAEWAKNEAQAARAATDAAGGGSR